MNFTFLGLQGGEEIPTWSFTFDMVTVLIILAVVIILTARSSRRINKAEIERLRKKEEFEKECKKID